VDSVLPIPLHFDSSKEGGVSVTTSLVIAIVISIVILYRLIKSRQKEAHHLDDLHIVGSKNPKKH